ncbi:MAG: DUF4910 domain-containing protein [Candidatus Heimdallarchaeota archaeon]
MSLEKLLHKVTRELSGERAKRFTGYLSQYHRIQASKEFLSAIKFVQNELEKLGDTNSKIHEYTADGTRRYYDWNTPISWDIEDGELLLVEPVKKILCKFSEVPESVCTHSKPVDLEAEVIHIGDASPEEMNDNNVEGKIVLTTGSPRSMIDLLADHGAIGVIAYPSEQRAQGYLQMIQYVGLWPNAENKNKSTFGFSLSRKQAIELIKYQKEGKKIVVKAKIKAKLYEGNMHVLSTKIEGTVRPEEEIILVAHICHPAPSANDNASGSALLLEIYRTIKSLIDQKKITKPERTIRFLWVPEFHGTMPWIADQKQKENFKPIYCINLDMVGEHPALVGYPFTLNKASVSTPSFLNDLITEVIEIVKDYSDAIEQGGWQFPWNYRIKPFAGGSDQLLFNDEPLRIPSVMFGHPDTFHHTNLDSIEKVDPSTLKRVGSTVVVTVLASSYENEFSEEIVRAFQKGYQIRKGQLLNLIVRELSAPISLEEEAKNEHLYLINSTIGRFIDFEKLALESIKLSFPSIGSKLLEFVKSDREKLQQTIIESMQIQTNFEVKSDIIKIFKQIPVRNWRGPLNAYSIFNIEKLEKENDEKLKMKQDQLQRIKQFLEKSRADYGGFLLELINLIDNKNTVEEIISFLSLIEWKIPQIKEIFDFLDLLERLELIEIK